MSKHPAVVAGKMTKEEVLQEFLNSFEGTEGNRDGKVTLDEWMRHYEEVSCSIDNDDYFGTLMATTWSHLKQKMPDGSKVTIPPFPYLSSVIDLVLTMPCVYTTDLKPLPFSFTLQVNAVKFVARADVERVEKKLKDSIYEKTPPNTNTRRTAELAFRALDTDGSGGVNLDEFIKALERFGMHVRAYRHVPARPRDGAVADLVTSHMSLIRFRRSGNGRAAGRWRPPQGDGAGALQQVRH